MNAGLQSGAAGIFHATGPQIPDQETLNSLGAPLVRIVLVVLFVVGVVADAGCGMQSREELAKREAELNK
jgi:hypothetical protein